MYRRRGEEEEWRVMENWMELGRDEKVLIEGDLNAWTGEMGSGIWDEEEKYIRKSKHGEVDKQGKKLLKVLAERGWTILNGNVKGMRRRNLHMYEGVIQ